MPTQPIRDSPDQKNGLLLDPVVRIPVFFFLVVPLVVEVVVLRDGVFVYVGESARAFTEQAVVVPLLELARFTEAARSSFSGHVVTVLRVVTVIMPSPRRPVAAGRETAGDRSGRGGRCCLRGASAAVRRRPAAS